MIKPTVGRVVLFHHMGLFPHVIAHSDTFAAMVVHVWSDTCVNLVIFDSNGMLFNATSVDLIQDEREYPAHPHAFWMAYQKGQAAKVDEMDAVLKTVAAARAAGPTGY